jgi:hypothetical protein
LSEDHKELTRVELIHAMTGLAAGIRGLYDGLVEEGFEPMEALRLTGEYVRGIAQGARS